MKIHAPSSSLFAAFQLRCYDLHLITHFAASYMASYTGWPKKVSHFQVSSLNRIKIVTKATFFINFDYKTNTRI